MRKRRLTQGPAAIRFDDLIDLASDAGYELDPGFLQEGEKRARSPPRR